MAEWWENDPISSATASGAATSAEWWGKDPVKPPVDVAGEVTAPFAGFNKGFDALANLPGTALNLGARALGYEPPFKPVPIFSNFNTGQFVDKTLTGNEAAYEPQTLPGRVGEAIGEVAGASVLPEAGMLTKAASLTPQTARVAAPLLERMAAQGPVASVKEAILPTVGAGLGTAGAREADLGPVGEMAGGLIGGFAFPNAANLGARAYGAARGAKAYAGRQFARAGDPQLAADQDTVDALLKAGVEPESLFKEFAPTPSAALQREGITGEKMADMIARSAAGDPVEQIARENGIAESTLQKYLREHKAAHPTPRNVADVVQDRTNVGYAQPVLRLGRTAFGIADDGTAAGALTTRQNDQYGRMVNIFRRAAKGRDYEETLAANDETLGTKSNQAYGLARQNEQPFDLTPSLRSQRETANASAGEIRDTLNKAIDLFFEPIAQPKRISAMDDVRMQEMQERINRAEAAETPDPVKIAQLKRRFDAMRDDAEYNANAKPEVHKIGKPIGDVERFRASREALDHMIEGSKNAQGKGTPLTRKLTALRKTVNNVMRNANPLMAAADDQFSGAKTTQALIKRGEDLTTRLGSKTDEFFKDFADLHPEQREVIRLAFLRKMENQAATPQEGAAIANQFRSNAVKQTITRLFGPEKIPEKAAPEVKKAIAARNRENIALGKQLIEGGRQEATTTHTLNAITARGNSPSAPWQRDMAIAQEGAEVVGDALTLNWMGVLKKTGKKLANQIGERGSKAILDNLTNTAPEEVIPKIRRWVQLAKTAQERKNYVIALREFARVQRDTGTDIGTVVAPSAERTSPRNRLPAP